MRLLPWRRGLCHPHQIHVAGKNRQLERQLEIVGKGRTPVRQEHIDEELKVRLPSDRLPKQDDRCKEQTLRVRTDGHAERSEVSGVTDSHKTTEEKMLG